MVLAVAALLLQFHSFQPAAPAASIVPAENTTTATEISLKLSAPAAASAAKSADYVTAATESSSTRMNLAAVRFDSADSKTHVSGTLTLFRSTRLPTRSRSRPFAFRRRLRRNLESRKR